MFIDRHVKTHGVSPSFDEMKDALSLRSKSGIHRLITGLEERGFIRRLPHRARALEVMKLPENVRGARAHGKEGFTPNVIEGRFRAAPAAEASSPSETVGLPLYGRIDRKSTRLNSSH